MKKIFYTAILILMAGMLVGCASTASPTTTSKSRKSSENKIYNGVYDKTISDVYDDIYWKKSSYGGIVALAIDEGKILELRKPSDPDRDPRIQNTFNKLINSPKISGRDFMKILACQHFFRPRWEFGSKTQTPFFTLRDFLNEKEINGKNPFTGKIINNTNETLKLFLCFAGTIDDERNFYFEVPPHEERFFKISRSSELSENYFGISDKVGQNNRLLTWIGKENPEDKYGESASGIEYDLQAGYARYIFDNYSFEMTFDEETYDDNLNSWVLNWNYWTLVPHYEVDESALTNPLSREEVNQRFNMRF